MRAMPGAAVIMSGLATVLDAGRRLDKHYIPARYPNGFASGTPGDYYMEQDADQAIKDADEILRLCESA